MRALADVKPNTWNPNAMTTFERESLKEGLLSDGWLASQALLIWGTDEKGKPKNIIIDGEQRWTVARDIGFKEAPMVFLEKLPAVEAKKLTIKMDAKRGKFRDEPLLRVLQEINAEVMLTNPDLDLALDLGIVEEDLKRFLFRDPDAPKGVNAPLEEWTGMPECSSEDQTAWGSVKINFANEADMQAFSALVGQTVLETTRSIWYPKAEIGHIADKAYEHDDAAAAP